MVSESEDPVASVVKKRPLRSRRQMYLQTAVAAVILFCGIVIGSGAALLHFKDDIVHDRRPPLGAIVEDIRSNHPFKPHQTP